jgi:hypothetical protein
LDREFYISNCCDSLFFCTETMHCAAAIFSGCGFLPN